MNQNHKFNSSTPSIGQFNPTIIPYQKRVINDIDFNFDYSLGTHEILLSGSVGSAKSILMAHLLCRHAMENEGATALMGRRTLPALRDTLYKKIVEHLSDDQLVEGYHYKLNDKECRIEFPPWGSQLIGGSWADAKFEKYRSLELSMACFEELTENKEDHIFREIKMRVGRLPHIKRNLIVAATNPDAPSHWAYQYFIEPNKQGRHQTRHVYYSITTDNPFLPKWYIEQLRNDLDPKQAKRMIFGEWIEINQDVIYHSYESENSYRDYEYKVIPEKPLLITFDFNIGQGKPMSCIIGQYHEETDTYHWFDEVIVHGARTHDVMEELYSKGHLDHPSKIEIYGDATGDRRDTRSLLTDYDIIKRYMANYRTKDNRIPVWLTYVPRDNPSVRTRHNIVNGYCRNDLGKTRLFVYKKCKTLDKGLRLTKLKDGGSYVEDDTPEYQHCTTALGYCIVYKYNLGKNIKVGTL